MGVMAARTGTAAREGSLQARYSLTWPVGPVKLTHWPLQHRRDGLHMGLAMSRRGQLSKRSGSLLGKTYAMISFVWLLEGAYSRVE